MNKHARLPSILMLGAAVISVSGCPKDDDSAQRIMVIVPSPTPTSTPSPTAAPTAAPTPAADSSPTPKPALIATPSPAVDSSPQPQSEDHDEGKSGDAGGSPGAVDAADESGELAVTSVTDGKDVFKIQITLNRDGVTEYDEPTYFVGDQAIELVWSGSGKLLATYDLADMSWWEASSGNLFTLADCKDWAQRSLETTREALSETPDSITKRFVLAMMEPDLEVTNGEGTLTVSNEFYTFTYNTDGPVDPGRLKRFLAYDRLKNYRKSMLFRDSPPFMRLEIDDLLEKRAMFPHRTELKVKLPGADSNSTITMTIDSVTEEEMNTLSGYIE